MSDNNQQTGQDTPALAQTAVVENTAADAQALDTHVPLVYGQPYPDMPKDLYIPPEALEVFLDSFEGPMDLLLYLIRKVNINVLDIPMAELTAQYLTYVEAMRSHNLELAAEYLLMAAMLLEIKSRMLLPRPKQEETEVQDPRAELVRRLLEYEQMKLAAAKIDRLPQAERDYEWVTVEITETIAQRLPDVSMQDLQDAWLGLMKQARMMQHHKIHREELSVREHMTLILRKLQSTSYVPFVELFDLKLGASGLVVSFLAVLELVRESLVEVSQREVLAPIYVKLHQTGPADVSHA